jgi:uncharacterized protein (DUF433 family)
VAERRRYTQALTQVRVEMAARWPELTTFNIREALEYQEQRLAELTKPATPVGG